MRSNPIYFVDKLVEWEGGTSSSHHAVAFRSASDAFEHIFKVINNDPREYEHKDVKWRFNTTGDWHSRGFADVEIIGEGLFCYHEEDGCTMLPGKCTIRFSEIWLREEK